MLQYSYEPLEGDDIRVIQLLPGEYDDDIRIRITHVPLIVPEDSQEDEALIEEQVLSSLPEGWEAMQTPEGRWLYHAPGHTGEIYHNHPTGLEIAQKPEFTGNEYEALSYAWGDRNYQCPVYIVPDLRDAAAICTLSINGSLGLALRCLRSTSEKTTLWVDAVCINQSDVQERNQQLLRMRNIYAMARRVVVWLGIGSIDSDHALNLLQYLGNQAEITVGGHRVMTSHATEGDWYSVSTDLCYNQQEWDAVANFFNRSWFNRLWTLQEIAVAQRNAIVRCGQHAISWSSLRRALVLLCGRQGAPLELVPMVTSKRPIAFGIRHMNLLDVLFLSRHHLCEEPRDHVYGVLSFLGPKLRDQIQQPDYHRPLTDIHRDVFLRHSEITQRLDLLAHASVGPKSESPSWVVSWKYFPNTSHGSRSYRAAGMSRSYFRCISADILQASGLILTTVSDVNADQVSEGYELLRSNINHINFRNIARNHRYITGEDFQYAWARTLIGDISVERHPESDNIRLDQMKDAIASLYQAPDTPAARESFEELLSTRFLKDHLSCFRVLSTEEGHIGFGPVQMRKGDHICLLLGVFTPLVVRPTANGCFEIIGWAYVHGIMDGEALLGPLPHGWTVVYRLRSGHYRVRFRNLTTDSEQVDDPRLGSLPTVWSRVDIKHTLDDPEHVDYFRNDKTGELINYDPRMSLEALELRGVQLQDIQFA